MPPLLSTAPPIAPPLPPDHPHLSRAFAAHASRNTGLQAGLARVLLTRGVLVVHGDGSWEASEAVLRAVDSLGRGRGRGSGRR
ncbi:MAG: hypothetical protein M1832_005613 [Thelocarpon impressellum]|nr:MAG: hypothetical protein M1832_005613 [Thelocarpon impressellum]